MTPEKFGNYILLDKLAAGGMAEVFLAKKIGAGGLSKFHAMKRILPQYSANADFIDMFKTEAKIAINISHSNIVSIYEFGESNKQFYIVMELVQGKNLRQLFNKMRKREQKLSIEHIVFVINEVAKGLDYAHRCIDRTTGKPLNIIHRDMSPQNVMLSYEGEVKLVDFGIAKAESKIEATQAGTLKGKFGYMSPEQAEGMELDLRTDIFSLGIIMWEMIAGDRLFSANNEINTIRKIRDCHIPDLNKIEPGIHYDVVAIVNKALARDRSLRYQSANDMHRDLNKFLNKHYPEYTSQDFSHLIKQLYTQEILANREKMIEFSNLNSDSESDAVETTRTITNTTQNSISKSSALSAHNEKSLIKNIDFDFVKKNSNYVVPVKKGTNTNITGSYYNNTQSYYSGSYNQKNSGSFLKFAIYILVIAFGAGVYLNRDDPEVQEILSDFGIQNTVPEERSRASANPPKPEVEEQKYSYYVRSRPSGAKIIVNGQDTGFVTPGRILIPANQSIQLTLRKLGRVDYSRRVTAIKNGQQLNIKLKKDSIGYLSIYTPGVVEISINGQKINQQPPLIKYPVKANRRLIVKAYNPTTKAVDETVVIVKKDTHQTIRLVPKRRRPARN